VFFDDVALFQQRYIGGIVVALDVNSCSSDACLRCFQPLFSSEVPLATSEANGGPKEDC
jgi:hypothetical protein